MSQTREEAAAEREKDLVEAAEKYGKDQRAAAEKARDEQPDAAETEEEYAARITAATATGIFGDIETGAAGPAQVPSSDNEAATVAVAEKDAAGSDASDDEARRQVDVQAGTTESAEDANAAAPEENADDTTQADGPAQKEDDAKTPAQKAAAKRQARS